MSWLNSLLGMAVPAIFAAIGLWWKLRGRKWWTERKRKRKVAAEGEFYSRVRDWVEMEKQVRRDMAKEERERAEWQKMFDEELARVRAKAARDEVTDEDLDKLRKLGEHAGDV